MAKGYKKPLTFDDLYDLPSRDKTAKLYPLFEREWVKAQKKYGVLSLYRNLMALKTCIIM